ncbi:udp-glucuronosyl udp-glucosyltransferase [Colletotrichum camelliae]|nr:udp-glucuronosyl udp-glucosyltransferase [Colletotrichum camelliae]
MTATETYDDGKGSKKPLLLMAAFPIDGHINPLFTIASHLVKVGYEVAFSSPSVYQSKIEETGAEYILAESPITESVFLNFRDASQFPPGPGRLAAQYKAIFMDMQPTRAKSIEEALVVLQARDPDRQIIVLEDVFNSGFTAFKYGRPLPDGVKRLPKSIGFGVSPILAESQDTGPLSLGLWPDSTESGRQRNKALYELVEKGPMKLLYDAWHETLKQCGCTNIPDGKIWRSFYTAHDSILQLCSPRVFCHASLEKRQEHNYRHVIFVSQGTLNPLWSELIIPAINAFADRPDVLVVATLGAVGARLPAEVKIPTNARVIDYLPYDAMLEYTDVFISNAGYGTLTHAVSNGVPVLLAGENEEKIEVTMRAVYAGVGLSLGTQTPTAEQVRRGVECILEDTKYKKAAMRLKMENSDLDALSAIEAKIREMTE